MGAYHNVGHRATWKIISTPFDLAQGRLSTEDTESLFEKNSFRDLSASVVIFLGRG